MAVSSKARSEVLPDVPSLAEFIPGYEVSGWYGIGAPKGTPGEIISTLNREINAALADASFRMHLADLGSVPMPMSPADFQKFIVEETDKWGKVVRSANIKPE